MSAHLPARLEVDGLRRLTEAAGGHATVLFRGDPDRGVVLVVIAAAADDAVFERTPAFAGPIRWERVGGESAASDYLARRRRSDPDLWAVELSDLRDPQAILAQLAG